MPQYMKSTGQLITVRPKKESAANQGRMILDDALIEMLDIMLPVGELKTFATDEIDSWIAKMSEYGQEWVEPDGRLLKVSDYPDLFALIGYNYGWSSTNPNGTYTYSFTDVNGVARSLQIYNDLEIDGNAKSAEGSPSYFRIPNLAGRFLRCAGTATYVNKWQDSDNVTRQLLTEYSAPMYKGQLDAQRDIRGSKNNFLMSTGVNGDEESSGTGPFYTTSGANYIKVGNGSALWASIRTMIFTSSHIIPFAYENHPLDISAIVLIRIT